MRVVAPELEAQLPRQLPDGLVRAGQEMPVAALQPPIEPILAPTGGAVDVRIVAHNHETGRFAACVQQLLHAQHLAKGGRADAVTAGIGHGQDDALADQICKRQSLALLVTPLLRQLIEPRAADSSCRSAASSEQ